jgi:hypothetical protein
MTRIEKLQLRKLIQFKKQKFNELLTQIVKVTRREEGNNVYEDIIIDGKLIAYFLYDGQTVKFVRCNGGDACVEEPKGSIEGMNNQPQS